MGGGRCAPAWASPGSLPFTTAALVLPASCLLLCPLTAPAFLLLPWAWQASELTAFTASRRE